MKRNVFCLLLFLASVVAVAAQQPAQAPAWDVTVQTNTVAGSTLTVMNRCQKNHQFQVQPTKLPFLIFSSTQVNVKGGATHQVPVKFDTRNLAPGVYQGTVQVICQSCKGEATCVQDREVLQVILRVTGESPAAGPQGAQTQTNQPTNAPTTNQPPSSQPATIQPASPVTDTTPDKQSGTSGATIGVTTKLLLTDDRCVALAEESERLRQIAEEKKAAAALAQSEADKLKESAEQAEKDAKAAEDAAKQAARAAEPKSGGTITAEGETFTQADNDWLEAKKQKLLADRMAGKLSPEEHERQRQELSGPDALKQAREERLANEAKLRKEADEAKAGAARARADADKAKAAAAAARKAADAARKEADEARKAHEDAERKRAEECRKQQEARAREEAKAAADKVEAERLRVKDEARKRTEADNRAQADADTKYLLDNIRDLHLIDSSPFKDIPGGLDKVIDFLLPEILHTKDERDLAKFLAEQVAEAITGNPIPLNSLQALGGLYQVLAKLLDPCSPLGAPRIVQRLQDGDTGRKYSLNEALNKVDRMCKLLKELKSKIEAIKRLQEQKTK